MKTPIALCLAVVMAVLPTLATQPPAMPPLPPPIHHHAPPPTTGTTQLTTTSIHLFSADTQLQQDDPKLLSCILTWLCIGILVICLYACWYNGIMSDHIKTNQPPVIPPLTNAPPTNNITNFYPASALNPNGAFIYANVTGSGWTNPDGSAISMVTQFYLQSSGAPGGPWSNLFTVTSWISPSGTMVRLADWRNSPVWTNFASITGSNIYNFFPPHLMDFTKPKQFFRIKAPTP